MTTAISLESPRPRRRARGITLAVQLGVVVALSAPTAAQAVQVKSHYYDNYFYSAATCKARGQALMRTQPDWITFLCYRDSGDKKWSMDAYIDDGFGCRVASPAKADSLGADSVVAPLCGGIA